MSLHANAAANRAAGLWFPIFAGLCASLVSIGLARFAYTPLIPVLINQGWFSQSQVVFLGAANLAGYLIGALIGHPMGRRWSNPTVLRWMLVAATLSFFACAFPLSISWYFGWRLISGVAGGSIMVLVASTVLPHIPPTRRGMASGAIFLGVGLGIAGSGTLIPILLAHGLQATWIGLGLISLALTAVSWRGWAEASVLNATKATEQAQDIATDNKALYTLFAQYALMAAGLVPAMVFLVDFITRGLNAGSHSASVVWAFYGLGSIIGPVLYGYACDKFGSRAGIRIALVIQAVAVGALSVSDQLWVLAGLAIIIGSFPPGIVPLALARVQELKPNPQHQQVAWSKATVSFATFQALAGVSYSAIFNATGGNYTVLFEIAAVVLAASLAIEPVARFWLGNRKSNSCSTPCQTAA